MSNHLQSTRLLLRPASDEDISGIEEVSGSSDPNRIPSLIQQSALWWRDHGYGLWVIVDRKSEQIIGWCGLRPEASPESPELFYGLSPSARGAGLATEAATMGINYAFENCLAESIWAATEHSNKASARVMQRIGMWNEDRKILDGIDSVIYRISRPE